MQSQIRSRRAILRRGEQLPHPGLATGPQKGVLISVPLFHVIGLTGLAVREVAIFLYPNLNIAQMMAIVGGLKIVLVRRWAAEDGKIH